jgi:REP element-mobilizing transposase RayT
MIFGYAFSNCLPCESNDNARTMANTYTRIYIQVVFAVEARQYLVRREFKETIHKYITGIVVERDQKLLAIHCMPDHTHLLIGLRPSRALSDLVRDVKNVSSGFINRQRWFAGRFAWQEGFGAFSYGHSQLTTVIRYIQNQEQHHTRRSFLDEYRHFLRKFEIDHDERFLFKDLESGHS